MVHLRCFRLFPLALCLAACASTGGQPQSLNAGPAAASVSPSAAASSPVAAKPAASAAALAPFRVAVIGTAPSDVFFAVGKDAGIFARHGLNMDVQGVDGGASAKALLAGEIEARHGGPSSLIAAQASGADLKIVATTIGVYDSVVLVPDSITSLDQLRGKKVGGPGETATTTVGLLHLLSAAGMERGRDYTFISTGTSGGLSGPVAALMAHQIDAIGTQPEVARQALDQGGFHVLVDLAKRPDIASAYEGIDMQASYVQQYPDRVQAMIDGVIESVRFIRENKQPTQDAIRKYYRITDQAALDATYQREVELLAKSPLPVRSQFDDFIAALPKDAKPPTEAQMTALVEPRFVNDAIRRGLTNY
jgi:ABC-type nitrate/sulfonate/bicarbonate transport system substrate-binding protein